MCVCGRGAWRECLWLWWVKGEVLQAEMPDPTVFTKVQEVFLSKRFSVCCVPSVHFQSSNDCFDSFVKFYHYFLGRKFAILLAQLFPKSHGAARFEIGLCITLLSSRKSSFYVLYTDLLSDI